MGLSILLGVIIYIISFTNYSNSNTYNWSENKYKMD